jgi:hypothetical protein
MNTITLIVRARGNPEPYITVINPTVIPRVNEFVAFDDEDGIVETVRWVPSRTRPGDGAPGDLDVVVECRPKLSAFASREPS